jgi:hypothetical protein
MNEAKFTAREFPAMRDAFIRVAERAITWQRAEWKAGRLRDRYCQALDAMTPVVKAAKPVISDYQI